MDDAKAVIGVEDGRLVVTGAEVQYVYLGAASILYIRIPESQYTMQFLGELQRHFADLRRVSRAPFGCLVLCGHQPLEFAPIHDEVMASHGWVRAESKVANAAEIPLDRVALTIWKDGSYQVWGGADANYAQADPDYLVSIGLGELQILAMSETAQVEDPGGAVATESNS